MSLNLGVARVGAALPEAHNPRPGNIAVKPVVFPNDFSTYSGKRVVPMARLRLWASNMGSSLGWKCTINN